MKAAVWDSYIKKDNGNVLHFDVVVPDSRSETAIVYKYAYEYLKSKGIDSAEINVKNCQFCHIENLTDEMISDIESKGFYIIEMDEISSELPDNPTRREMILFCGHILMNTDMQNSEIKPIFRLCKLFRN